MAELIYVPCLHCSFLIPENTMHKCDCGRVHTAEWTWPPEWIDEPKQLPDNLPPHTDIEEFCEHCRLEGN